LERKTARGEENRGTPIAAAPGGKKRKGNQIPISRKGKEKEGRSATGRRREKSYTSRREKGEKKGTEGAFTGPSRGLVMGEKSLSISFIGRRKKKGGEKRIPIRSAKRNFSHSITAPQMEKKGKSDDSVLFIGKKGGKGKRRTLRKDCDSFTPSSEEEGGGGRAF